MFTDIELNGYFSNKYFQGLKQYLNFSLSDYMVSEVYSCLNYLLIIILMREIQLGFFKYFLFNLKNFLFFIFIFIKPF